MALRNVARQAWNLGVQGGRNYAKAAAGKSDLIGDIFVKSQQDFRALLAATKNMSITVGQHDAAAAKKLAQETDAIKKKLEIPNVAERLQLALAQKKDAATGSVRAYLVGAAALRAELGIATSEGVDTIALAALDKVEKASGKAVTFADKAGMDALKKELASVGAGDVNALEEAAKVEECQNFLIKLTEDAKDTIEMAKTRDGLAGVDIDLAKLKPASL